MIFFRHLQGSGTGAAPRGSAGRRRGRAWAREGFALAAVAAWMCGAAVPAAQPESGAARPSLPPAGAIAKLPPDGGPEFNRLIFEKSPYLQQHARNPVDWYPWGEEAFAKAAAEDKPVFLSIGYSTCHWCHVMRRESFEDPEVAALLNENFVAIKVDREERPDVDHLYMQVTQAMTGGGGWPMTVIMGPDRLPFFTGTYFPKTGRLGRPGVMEILREVTRLWREDRASLEATARQVADFLAGESAAAPAGGETSTAAEGLGTETLAAAFAQLRERYDAETGGFGRAPKFPSPHHLMFLLRYGARTGDTEATRMAADTLRAMRAGGVFDHVGFGFHRYATDQTWLLPHFEKMLYDQAMLAIAYTEAFLATGDAAFGRTAREILGYVLRDLTAPEGGFYSAEDADSEGGEGVFYQWTEAQVREALGEEDAARWMQVFGFQPGGNFREEASGERTGRNIPHRDRSNGAWAEDFGLEPAAFELWLETTRAKLFEARERRPRPMMDDKILTDWNGLMIAALARASRALDEPAYAAAAAKAADFALAHLRAPGGRLMKRYRAGEAGLEAHLDDYAFLAWGLIELYQTAFEPRYLEAALELTDRMLEDFGTGEGGFYFAAEGTGGLPLRPRQLYDAPTPAGNSVAALNLLRLARLTGRTAYEERVDRVFETMAEGVRAEPAWHTFLLTAVDFAAGPGFEIVIAGDPEAGDTRAMLAALNGRFLPNAVVLLRAEGEAGERLATLAPFTAAQRMVDGRATAYVCQNFACEAPTNDVGVMLASLSLRRMERTLTK